MIAQDPSLSAKALSEKISALESLMQCKKADGEYRRNDDAANKEQNGGLYEIGIITHFC